MNLTTDIYQRIVSAKLFIDNNYQDTIDLDMVAQQALISKFHFHRIFKQVYHKTPHQYITQKRLEKAKTLLSENKLVTEVCNEVGFESITSFTSLFKKEMGFPPTYYRNMAWLKKQASLQQPKRFIPHCFIEQYKFSE